MPGDNGLAGNDHTAELIETGGKLTKVGFGGAASSPFINWAVQNSEIITLFLGVGGLAVAIAGFSMTWYYSHKRYLLILKEHKNRLKD
jgi:hypothetical protein